jgi:NAD(P)-dependent dehydrogenase (short-subunit alcohol dehydrogenase family)
MMCKPTQAPSSSSPPLKLIFVIFLAVFYKFAFSSPKRLQPVQPGYTILVTGSSSGIGKHAALSLVKEGYTVFACVRKEKDGEALIKSAEQFELDTSLLKPIILDVTNSEHIQKTVQVIDSFVGERGLKGLFNNAGVYLEPSSDTTSAEFLDMPLYRRTFDVNYFGLVEVTKAFLPLLREGGGRIIMNTSVAGIIATPFISAYTSSKHAVEGFSDALRRELLPHGVSVSVLEPGYIMTPILAPAVPEGTEPYRAQERKYRKQFYKSSLNAPSPKVTSEAVVDAMRSESPKIRYCVGGDAGIISFLARLPSHWLDSLMAFSPDVDLTEEELHQLSGNTKMDFEL